MVSTDFLAITPEIAVAVLALLLVAVALLLPQGARKGLVPLNVFGLLGILAYTVYDFFFGKMGPVFRGMYYHDQFADFFKILFLTAAILVILSSREYIGKWPAYRGNFYALLTAAILGMMIMASSADLLTFYVGLELMTITFYILVGYLPHDGRSSEAGIKYLVLGASSSAILLYGISFIYGLTGSTQLSGIGAQLGSSLTPPIILATVFLLAGLGFKISLVPFHMWAPDIYEGAPTPVTAFLAVASKAAAFAAVIRIYLVTLEHQSFVQTGVALLLILAALTMIVGNLVAIPQKNIKRLLAFSSIAQAGYLMVGVIAESVAGVKGVLFYAMIYVFANMGAFAVATYVGQAQGSDEIRDYAGLARRSPLAAAVMTASVLSLAGIPPLAGFVGKFYLFSAVIHQGYTWIAYVGFVMSMVSVYYYLSVVKVMYLGEGADLPDIPVHGAAKFTMVFTMLITLFIGLYPTPLAQMAISAATSLVK
ncbi:NADH:ubiquinone reductase (H+-translocating) [Acididesulfobacillus acetoxydans]|uniref:NADH-quinone oxidoreductase subunit N n=1 Tax=Acididesulfobacillus acetoxydans TaxID=1561005 RepID=A0A8S0WQL0_9FIRM|nr:NADH-quinone oxidoreductase subunit N [Acididesulfobacillus acetoxydans]CAA7602694.1 NADH:ubiquinone reductase (H+-translocating) [Acididesulfobacillus acetoxydans]CEJ06449.1 NADH-quinone oxidoreductase subunit N [Acididesulfobacillus acetoxydans]